MADDERDTAGEVFADALRRWREAISSDADADADRDEADAARRGDEEDPSGGVNPTDANDG